MRQQEQVFGSKLDGRHWKRKRKSTARQRPRSGHSGEARGALASRWSADEASASQMNGLTNAKTSMIDVLRTRQGQEQQQQQWRQESAPLEAVTKVKLSNWPAPYCKNAKLGQDRPQLSCSNRDTEASAPATGARSRGVRNKSGQARTRTMWCRRRSHNNRRDAISQPHASNGMLYSFPCYLAVLLALQLAPLDVASQSASVVQSDPRPTIYSGQVSFGLLLSAHSSLGAELSSSASRQVTALTLATQDALDQESTTTVASLTATTYVTDEPGHHPDTLVAAASDVDGEQLAEGQVHRDSRPMRGHGKRQIFERTSSYHVRRQQQQQQQLQKANSKPASSSHQDSGCSQVNPNALYAGMGAIWASHQANLVGDSQLAIGTYIYDSCNDLDVGQRQSVRIVSNLNAFQQTTCESPRGSPISVTIAHGDNQLRAIQLLTSFRVPVITTREHFALEDYSQLSRDQRKFLFSTAPSSRHLAVGALRFSKRVVSRSTSSPKLPNQFHKMSSKNGLIVISRNLPARFIAYLTETIPNHVNYEMLQSNQPIDQVRSVEVLESILFKASQQSGSSQQSASESQVVPVKVSPPPPTVRVRNQRSADDADSSPSSDSDGSEDAITQQRMLSPTILMFITPAEAIDLVTRLRNDLAEVSKYYSLIVTTREDISPALKTIFHRGGSHLCSGKAFYTISPIPDDISEFSRYFRDTVQMEGESSDHPLINEFAKYQATSKISADLDDISTEPVIKAVWSAAAAFKSVYRRECGSLTSSAPSSNSYQATGGSSEPPSDSYRPTTHKQNRQSSNKSAHSECMTKMNKNMSNLVQKALKRLDVTINSTGLQALDGFRIKFDELNELMTNKFSIKYINKECDIIEIGQYSGFKDSALRLDDDLLLKSLDSTLPDPWPVTQAAPISSTTTAAILSSGSSSQGLSPSPVSSSSESTPLSGDSDSSSDSSPSPTPDASSTSGDEPAAGTNRPGQPAHGADDEDSSSGLRESDKVPVTSPESVQTGEPSKKRRSSVKLARRKLQNAQMRHRKQVAAPITAMGGRGLTPGLTDTEEARTTEEPASNSTKEQQVTVAPDRQQATRSPALAKAMRTLKPFPAGTATTLKNWLPKSTTDEPVATKSPADDSSLLPKKTTEDGQLVGSQVGDLKVKGTTQAPTYSTLPESGGNTDLEIPTTKNGAKSSSLAPISPGTRSLETASTTEASDYVTLPLSMVTSGPEQFRRGFTLDASAELANQTHRSSGEDFNLRDLNSSPVPLSSSKSLGTESLRLATNSQIHSQDSQSSADHKSSRSKLRSHLKWIYSSWFTLAILGANICGALFTLYVLTFLLMKNCDGSLDRENQGIRSMHLLAIIVVFFGSTLFIVYPTPGLCLLRTSWHNFAMVLIFGSLLLQAMQIRSLNSLGLGGRPNRLNQFLTLVFLVGVQVSFELQRWKYESANYVNFVNQYFGSSENGDKKLMILSSTMAGQFNPLNSFNDQVTPVSIQVSEKYQNLLQDYCSQPADDFLQSQMYLWLIIGLLLLFCLTSRRNGRLSGAATSSNHQKLTSALISGKLLASQHEANFNITPSQFQFAPNVMASTSSSAAIGNVFIVTLISAPIYFLSIILHVHGQNLANHDLIFSVTMVLVAFTTLFGIFLPILHQVHRLDGLMSPSSADPLVSSLSRNVTATQSSKLKHDASPASSPAFAMFPEFAPTGLRRPSSISGDSSSGAGSRRPFAETKESRRNMSVALANLGPSEDSLRNIGVYSQQDRKLEHPIDPALLNLKLNLNADDEMSPMVEHDLYKTPHNHNHNANHHHHQHGYNKHREQPRRSSSSGEKRLIMLDVDPCCPRHGVAAWPRNDSCPDRTQTSSNSKNCVHDLRTSHSHH